MIARYRAPLGGAACGSTQFAAGPCGGFRPCHEGWRTVVAEQLQPTVLDVAREIAELRPISIIARKVLALTEDDRFSARELARVISSDQALTAKMLRLSNSAYYGYSREIYTVQDAIVLLGFRAVRSATLASCVISAAGGTQNMDYVQFWRYSVTVGVLAELIALADGHSDAEAFTAGVVHNIGRLAFDQHMPDRFAEARHYATQHRVPLAQAQVAVVGFTDASLGAALALLWEFPEELANAVIHHELDPAELKERSTLTGYVVRARTMAISQGLSDGLEPRLAGAPPLEWTLPPLAQAYERVGGLEGVRHKVSAFLENASVF